MPCSIRARCKAPDKRPAGDRCRPEWGDSAISCVLRQGGIRADEKALIKELEHAAGGRRQLRPGLVRAEGKGGQSVSQISELLQQKGYTLGRQGQHDEGQTLEYLVNCLRGWGSCTPHPAADECATLRATCEQKK